MDHNPAASAHLGRRLGGVRGSCLDMASLTCVLLSPVQHACLVNSRSLIVLHGMDTRPRASPCCSFAPPTPPSPFSQAQSGTRKPEAYLTTEHSGDLWTVDVRTSYHTEPARVDKTIHCTSLRDPPHLPSGIYRYSDTLLDSPTPYPYTSQRPPGGVVTIPTLSPISIRLAPPTFLSSQSSRHSPAGSILAASNRLKASGLREPPPERSSIT